MFHNPFFFFGILWVRPLMLLMAACTPFVVFENPPRSSKPATEEKD